MQNNSSCTALEWGSEVGIRLYEIQRARQVSVERPREATGLPFVVFQRGDDLFAEPE